MEPTVHTIFEPRTGTWQYIVADPEKRQAVVIDSVLNYDKETGAISTHSADQILKLIGEEGYNISRILETHVHADHPTASRYLQNMLTPETSASGPPVCIGKRVGEVQATLGKLYGIPVEHFEGSFDYTFEDEEEFHIGGIRAHVVHLPGHTPDHIGYIIGSNVFVGDSLFNPDVGSARCDFPGGDAPALYESVQRLMALPPDYRLYTGHDYPPASRVQGGDTSPQPLPYTTVEQQRKENKHLKDGTSKAEFVEWRKSRDGTLTEPKLMFTAMHVNLRGGRVPVSGVDGLRVDEQTASKHLARI